ncbi:MAG: hypothetical protein QOG79_1616 [Mycobacterium sp.]|jgi:hypothetical protein|nr:hypothetical protein [Mycobacterium sp.]MDT5285379.1 hypothetical protein [Mycobacterium sp.]MDT5298374.1 hypothetical protein [Mycobacterium sp.]
MNPLLQGLEVQAVIGHDDDLTVDHATLRQLSGGGHDQLREVARHRPLVAATQLDFIAVPETYGPEAVPLRFIGGARRNRRNGLRQHRRERRHHGQVHQPILARRRDEIAAVHRST